MATITSQTDPYEFKLSPEMMQEIDTTLCERVEEVVLACQDRDDDLFELHLMLEGISQPTGSQPWPNACEVEASLVREFHTTLHAATSSSSKQFPYIITEPVNREDQDEADEYEQFINRKAQMDGYEEAIDDILYMALENKFAPMFVGYSQDIVKSYELGYKDGEGNIIDPEFRDPEKQYDEQLVVREDVVNQGIDFRPVTPWNFYVDPPDAPGVQVKDQCERTIERMLLTREHLTRGIKDYGYIEGQIKRLLELGPTGYQSDSRKQEINDYQGFNPQKADYWECFQIIGRLPVILDSNLDNTIPKRVQYVDFVWMVCPAYKVAFKRAFSSMPSGIRPYAIFNAFKKPNSLLGHGLVSLLRDLQNEMTALERFGINKLNLEATPMLSVPERWMVKYTKWKVAPGRLMPRVTDNPNEIHPVTWDTSSQNYIMAWMDRIDAYASRIAAAQSANSALAGKVRKATEVQFADAMMQTKFDLIQANINRGVKETFNIMSALVSQHSADDPNTTNSAVGRLSHDQVMRNFRFIPQANAEGANSSLRLQKDMVVGQIARSSAVFQARIMNGDLEGDWRLTHNQLVHAGMRNPEDIIGPNMAQEGGQWPQIQQQGGKTPAEMISFKDLAPNQRDAMAQQAGLPPAEAPQGMEGQDGSDYAGAMADMAGHHADLVQQAHDHQHDIVMQMMKQAHEKQLKGMDLQHQAIQGQQDRALQAQQSQQNAQMQMQEGQANREAQIQQAKMRPPAKSNGHGGKSK